MSSLRLAGVLVTAWVAVACGGSAGADGPGSTTFSLTLGGSAATFAHDDPFAGQTATEVSAGVRRVTFIDAEGGEWTPFDAGTGNVEVSYGSAARTTLVGLPASQVRAGSYVEARLVQDWSRFDVLADLHEAGSVHAGTLHALQVTSDQAAVGGELLELGSYRHEFHAPGIDRKYAGTAPVASHSTTAQAEANLENGEWTVLFPVDFELGAGAAGTLAISVNLDQAFRWQDLEAAGFSPGRYDIAPPVYEPVVQFGGNRFDVVWE